MDANEKKFLCKVYEEGNKPIDFNQIGKELGFTEDETKNIVLSLQEQRLVKLTVSSGEFGHGTLDDAGRRLAKKLCGGE